MSQKTTPQTTTPKNPMTYKDVDRIKKTRDAGDDFVRRAQRAAAKNEKSKG